MSCRRDARRSRGLCVRTPGGSGTLSMLNLDEDYLSTEHRQFRQQLRRYIANEVVPRAAAWEEAGAVPRQIFRQLGELGFLGLAVPVELGGSELDALGTVVFGEELGRSGFGGFAASITDHADMAAPVLVRSGTPEQQQRLLPDIAAGRKVLGFAVTEPGGGSDLTRMKTVAVRRAVLRRLPRSGRQPGRRGRPRFLPADARSGTRAHEPLLTVHRDDGACARNHP